MNINELDLENVGSWPLLYRAISVVLACILIIGGFFYFVTLPELDRLDTIKAQENKLKASFTAKAALSSNLEIYQEQMVEMKLLFNGLLKKLPSKKEVASLLDDISYIGENNGLQFKSINWGVVKESELSTEVPISLQVSGTYLQLGRFAADIAALPRIVILDNLRLAKGNNDILTLNVIAKTYRYKGGKK